MTDGSYNFLYSPAIGAKIFWATASYGGHSGIITSNSNGSIQVISKWGENPLMLHDVEDSPFSSSYYTYWK